MTHPCMDTYAVIPTGRTIRTPRAGAQAEFAFTRNGVVLSTGTRRSEERELALRLARPNANPLHGINGELR